MVGLLAILTASTVAVRPAQAASTDPVGNLQEQARAIAQKLDALQHQAEITSEQLNGAEYRLSQLQPRIDAARTTVQQRGAVERRAEAQLSGWAVRAYVDDNPGEALSRALNPAVGAASTRLGYTTALVGDRQQLVDNLAAARSDAQDALDDLNHDEAAARDAASRATLRRADLQRLAQSLQQLQRQVQGQLAVAVAQQQAALAAATQQRARQVAEVSESPHSAAPTIPGRGPAPGAPRQAGTPSPSTVVPPGTSPATAPPPSAPPSTAPPAPPPPVSSVPPAPGGAATAVAAAESQVGGRYVWGGASPSTGFDCSGLVSWAWAQAGVSLPHYAQAQYDLTRHLAESALQPGDLVFYADSTGYVYHVAMYIGAGEVVQALNETYGVVEGSLYSAGAAPYAYGRV